MLENSLKKLKELEASGKLAEFVANHPILNYVKYTKLHREVVLRLAKEHGVDIPTLEFHDLDKFLTYWFYTDEEVQNYHWQHSEHHNTESTDEAVLTEMMLDWESAPYTKPDKPLNAYDTLYRWYPQMVDRMKPLLERYGLAVHQENPQAVSEEEFERICSEISTESVVEDVKKAMYYYSDED